MKWIRIWVEETINRTTFQELNTLERGVWFSLLVLAGREPNPGIVEMRAGVPWKIPVLAEFINIPEEHLSLSIQKLIDVGKVEILPDSRIKIKNWDKYQTRYEKYYRDMPKNEHIESTAETKAGYSSSPSSSISNIKGGSGGIKVHPDLEKHIWVGITEKDILHWSKAFPLCNIKLELDRMLVYLDANPQKKYDRHKRFITNWLSRSSQRLTESSKPGVTWQEEADKWAKENMEKEKADEPDGI